MAKKIDIAQIFIWASNVLDTNQLTLAEHATLFNLIKLINRNFWKPIKISPFKLSRTMCSDKRTIEKALKSLANKKIIYHEEGLIFLGYVDEKTFKSLISQPDDSQNNVISSKHDITRRSDAGAGAGADTGADPGADPGADTGADPGADTGTGSEPKTLADF